MNYFDKFYSGLTILKEAGAEMIEFNPINRSYPNGTAQFSQSAIATVSYNWYKKGEMTDEDKKQLRLLHWKLEEGDQDYWTFGI